MARLSWGYREEHTSGGCNLSPAYKEREAALVSSAALRAQKRVWIRVVCSPSTLPLAWHRRSQPRSASGFPAARRGPAHSRRPPRVAPVAVETETASRRGGFRSSRGPLTGLRAADRDAEGQDPLRRALRGEARPAGAAGGGPGRRGTVPCAGSPPGRREFCPTAPIPWATLAAA